MADIPGKEIFLPAARELRRQVERGLRLADSGNIVALTLDREKRGAADCDLGRISSSPRPLSASANPH
jgi:hypothetical protein